MNRSIRVAGIAAFLMMFLSPAPAADWPGWLGPDRDGSSPETEIFAAGETAPSLDVAWKRSLGKAYSGIAVVDGKAITMFGDGEVDWLVAMDASTGKDVWRYRIDSMFPVVGGADGGQSGTPVVHDGVVYGLGAKGQLFAVKLSDGTEIWSVSAVEQLGAKQPYFGFATAPLVAGDLLFVQTGGEDGKSLTGLDRKTGRKLWAVGDDRVGYQSPILATLGGVRQIVAVTNKSVLGLHPKDGKVLWESSHGLVSRRDGWATPILVGDDTFVLTGGGESAAFRVGEKASGVSEVWRAESLKGNFAMPVVKDGYLYGYDGDFLACVDAATGERKWKERSKAAGLILVDDHLVIFLSDGAVVVSTASPEGYEERARVQAAKEGGYTYPSFSDGAIFVRNLADIARVNVKR